VTAATVSKSLSRPLLGMIGLCAIVYAGGAMETAVKLSTSPPDANADHIHWSATVRQARRVNRCQLTSRDRPGAGKRDLERAVGSEGVRITAPPLVSSLRLSISTTKKLQWVDEHRVYPVYSAKFASCGVLPAS
jgi:hypothetical protein